MPKVKRFQNSLKSAHGSHDAHGRSSSSATPTPSSSLASEVPQQEQAPTQTLNPCLIFARPAGRESTQYWKVEAIDSNKTVKHINIKASEVNNLPIEERIIVDFDNYGATYGEAQGLLAVYCGLLAIGGNLFPINFDRWSGPSSLPKKYMEDCFETLLKEQIQLSQGSINESEISADDIIGKLLDAEHSGRVRCMGMRASPSNTFKNIKQRLNDLNSSSSSFDVSSATSTYLHQKVTRLES
ncbi:hypothetical protein HAX54_032554 [Datura stramonium]|uniref:Uncharacterized protein n=1 Tax=Datura stramonium TaxID=4076 RepID=A0ABS8SCP3_DATST|nr:hypothetical protein [Datura stramonium]